MIVISKLLKLRSLSDLRGRVQLTTYYKGKSLKRDSTTFTVPCEWLEKHTKEEYNQELNEFLDSYTYDDSEIIKELAKKDNVFRY